MAEEPCPGSKQRLRSCGVVGAVEVGEEFWLRQEHRLLFPGESAFAPGLDRCIHRCAPRERESLWGGKEPAMLGNAQQFSVNSGQVGKRGLTEESRLDPVAKGEPLKVWKQSGDGHICVLNNSLLIVH